MCFYVLSWICRNVAFVIGDEMYRIGIVLILSLFWLVINLLMQRSNSLFIYSFVVVVPKNKTDEKKGVAKI